ncbi:MAG: YdiU family protein [Deltaproteobacteria bacterium]|nr:YdiU family protein [Deltaproteobacteria bacterium]
MQSDRDLEAISREATIVKARAITSAERLLCSDRLGGLPLGGLGFTAQVRVCGRLAIKLAHPTAASRRRLCEELDVLLALQTVSHALPLPRLYAWDRDRAALVRDWVDGVSVLELLRQGRGRLPAPVSNALWQTWAAAEALRRATGLGLEVSPGNLIYDAVLKRAVLVDAGVRHGYDPFAAVTRATLPRALRRYLRWRQRFDGPGFLRPSFWPPEARFYELTAVGPVPGARLLWVNERLRRRLGLDWSLRTLLRVANLATHARRKTELGLCSRYQDSPTTDAAGARGDGRAIYLGEIAGGPYGRRELMLKGCGRTPLRWAARAFHRDGFVSFPRTLWEVAVADELARLGFVTPEVLAILSTGKTTLDNTHRRWPAAAALRVADTHFRLAHLKLWESQPRALASLVNHVAPLLLAPRYDLQNPRTLPRLVRNFATNLGHDVGRSDALNIHGFNPTLGNVRLDGHFVDYSTVRFFRHYVPDYEFLNGKRRVRAHRQVWRLQVKRLVAVLATGRLLGGAEAGPLERRALARFDRAYVEGYVDGVAAFLGLRPETVRAQSPRQKRRLVARTVALRGLRAEAQVTFGYWQQRCPAPLFDLEGRVPALVRALRARQPEPWRALLSPYATDVSRPAARVASRWLAVFREWVPKRDLARLRPRRWSQVLRPFMELERLADLCYGRSRPEDFGVWQRRMSSGWGRGRRIFSRRAVPRER